MPLKLRIAVAGALLGAFLAVLNIQVTNASLPDIEGGIGTGGVNGTWISTAYLIGEIVTIPMTAFLSRVFSLRRYMITCTALFLLLSAACGQAGSLPEMIVLRMLQGLAGGVFIPLAFTIVVSMVPPRLRAAWLAAFSVTATFAPAIGPTIGGWLTDNYGWPMVFYMNLVPGAAMLAMLIHGLPRAPMQPGLLRRGDWVGIALMAVGLASLQTVLDEGNTLDWFGSDLIVRLSLLSAAALVLFVVVQLVRDAPLLNLRLLQRRNFGFGTLSNFLVGFGLYGAAYLLPQYLAVAQGFNAQQSGEVMAWVGLPQLLIIPFLPFLLRRFDARLLVAFGLSVFAASCFMNLNMDHDFSGPQLLAANVVRAVGIATTMTPLSVVAIVGIAPGEAGDASALFNMLRNLGGAVGTAAVETFFTKREQYHSFIINEHVSLLQPATRERLVALQHYFLAHGIADPATAMHQAVIAVGHAIRTQATVMGYSDSFGLLGVAVTGAALSAALLRKGTGAAGRAPAKRASPSCKNKTGRVQGP
jgi:DHA2 family multidrug resistance protein